MGGALVTGAGGFVGANLVRRLAADGEHVIAVTRPGGDPWRLAGAGDGVVRVEADLADTDAVGGLIAEHRPQDVFHLGAHGAYSWQRDLNAMVAVNVLGTAALLEAFRDSGGRAFVMAGSSSEYGLKDHPPAADERIEPNSHYAITKAAATHLVQLDAADHGTPAVVLRLYSVYGPWEEPARLLPSLVSHALRGELPPLVGPDTARDFVWIDDVCEAFVLAARRAGSLAGRVFNIASGYQTTLAELVAAAREQFGVVAEPDWGSMPARSWDTECWVGDPGATRRDLGWEASTTIAAGLGAMGDWLAHDAPAECYGVSPA